MPMVSIVVVLKLFLMGIAGTVPLARVVSCLGVGGLLLLVGWFAPMPGNGTAIGQRIQEAPDESTRP